MLKAFSCKKSQKLTEKHMKNIKLYAKKQLNIEITELMQKQFDVYCEFLREENEKYNLTAITDIEEIWQKHFLDSILGSIAIPQNVSLCDIGSGAGFPSLPLKIVRNDIDVTLVDSLEKRINFTKQLCQKIDLGANFYHVRAEDFAKNHLETFDITTARAVAPLNILLEYTAQTVKIGGCVIAYKTDTSEIESANNAACILGLKFERNYNFMLPDGSKRSILVYRKIKSTPIKYPRGQNKPRKNPL